MAKGLIIGLLISFVAFTIYTFWPKPEPARQTVTELKAEVAPENLELARTNPQLALTRARAEYYPELLAFLDLDTGITQPVADDYRQIFDRVSAYYGNDTRGQVVQAVFRIHEAIVYYPTLNYRESLEYLQDTVPAGFNAESGGSSGGKSIRDVAEEIYQYLVASYMQPEWDAMQAKIQENEQLQKRIDQNLQAARARGASINAARARAVAQHNAQLERNVNYSYNDYRSTTAYTSINNFYRGRRYY